MSERVPTAEDIRLAMIEVGYTHYEADDAIEAVKRRGIGIGHLAAQDNMQASIGAAFREAKAEAWDEGFDAGERDVMEHESGGWDRECIPNPYREEER